MCSKSAHRRKVGSQWSIHPRGQDQLNLNRKANVFFHKLFLKTLSITSHHINPGYIVWINRYLFIDIIRRGEHLINKSHGSLFSTSLVPCVMKRPSKQGRFSALPFLYQGRLPTLQRESNVELGCFISYHPGKAIQQPVELSVIGASLTCLLQTETKDCTRSE